MIAWKEQKTQFIRLLIGDDQEIRFLLGWLESQKNELLKENGTIKIVGLGKRKIVFNAKLLNMSFFKNFLIWYFAPIR
jgi:hypothetical protein